jgi:hypothetical protein
MAALSLLHGKGDTMATLKGLKVRVSIDGISLSCSPRSGNVFLADRIGKYVRIKKIKKNEAVLDDSLKNLDKRCKHYAWRFLYEHHNSKNLLWICTDRISKTHLVPSLYLNFFSSYNCLLRFRGVEETLSILENDHGLDFKISKIDLAVDLIHPQRINLHSRVLRAINPKRKRVIKVIKGTTKTLIMGAPGSSNRITAYDKRQQLKEAKAIIVHEDISRIEIRIRPHVLNNCIQLIQDLQQKGWAAFLYGRYFSLDHPQNSLKALLGEELSKRPIRKLKGVLTEKLGSTPDNFYRDYTREHNRFGPAVREALANFKWI